MAGTPVPPQSGSWPLPRPPSWKWSSEPPRRLAPKAVPPGRKAGLEWVPSGLALGLGPARASVDPRKPERASEQRQGAGQRKPPGSTPTHSPRPPAHHSWTFFPFKRQSVQEFLKREISGAVPLPPSKEVLEIISLAAGGHKTNYHQWVPSSHCF